LQRCFDAIGVSDGGSGGNACLDRTSSGVCSAITVHTVNEIINRDDNGNAIPDETADKRTNNNGVKIFDAANERASIAGINGAAASNFHASDDGTKIINAAAQHASVNAAVLSTSAHLMTTRKISTPPPNAPPLTPPSVASVNAAATFNDSASNDGAKIINAAAECASVTSVNNAFDDGAKIINAATERASSMAHPSTSPQSTVHFIHRIYAKVVSVNNAYVDGTSVNDAYSEL
jgi:hypothetical protein